MGMRSRRRTRKEVKKRERGFRERLKRFLIEYLVDNDSITIAELCKKLGRVNEKGNPKYNDVIYYVNALEEEGIIVTEKDKSIKRPGAKPTIIKLKKDIETLKKIWLNFPDLKPEIHRSKYFEKLVDELTEFAYKQIFGKFLDNITNEDMDKIQKLFRLSLIVRAFLSTLPTELNMWIKNGIKGSKTFIDLIFNGELEKKIIYTAKLHENDIEKGIEEEINKRKKRIKKLEIRRKRLKEELKKLFTLFSLNPPPTGYLIISHERKIKKLKEEIRMIKEVYKDLTIKYIILIRFWDWLLQDWPTFIIASCKIMDSEYDIEKLKEARSFLEEIEYKNQIEGYLDCIRDLKYIIKPKGNISADSSLFIVAHRIGERYYEKLQSKNATLEDYIECYENLRNTFLRADEYLKRAKDEEEREKIAKFLEELLYLRPLTPEEKKSIYSPYMRDLLSYFQSYYFKNFLTLIRDEFER